MKKLTAMILCLVMMLGIAACGGGDASQGEPEAGQSGEQQAPVGELTAESLLTYPVSPEEDFLVIDNGGEYGVSLYEYCGDDQVIVLPETVAGVAITRITGGLFSNSSPVRAVKLSDSVEILEKWVFANNESIEVVVFGSNMRDICSRDISGMDAGGVFLNCPNLREVVLNEGLEKIGAYAFSGCDSLMSIEIPASVTDIDPTAFFAMHDDFTIIGTPGSAAEQYATENGITFQAKN